MTFRFWECIDINIMCFFENFSCSNNEFVLINTLECRLFLDF